MTHLERALQQITHRYPLASDMVGTEFWQLEYDDMDMIELSNDEFWARNHIYYLIILESLGA